MEILYILIGLLILNILLNKKTKYIFKNTFKRNNKKQDFNEEPISSNYDYKNSYQPQYLMTINEKEQYRKLKEWANQHNLIIFCKVRLLDLITPRKNQENYKGALWKIQAKHVDFVICDQDIRVKCIVEINDQSHNRQDRAERDNFILEVLQACGYKVLMTYNINEEELNKICNYDQSTI